MSDDLTTLAPSADDERATLLPADEQDVLDQIRQWWREADRVSRDWREQAREDYAFVAGDQWTEEDQARLREQLRPCVTINRVGAVVDSVTGMEVSNRQEVRYIPRTEGDAGVNEVLTGAAQWMRDQCDAEDEESDAFLDVVICGEGVTETRVDYETDPEGRVEINRVDPLELWWDPGARKRNRDDARFVIRVKRDVPIAEARALFPEAEDDDLDARWAGRPGDDGRQPHDATEAPFYRNDQSDSTAAGIARKVTLVEAQWWEREPVYRVLDQSTGQATVMSGAEFGKLKKRLAMVPAGMVAPVKAARQQRRVFKRAFIGGRVLAPIDTPCEVSFTYRCITGKRDRNAGTWYGLVRAMKDPQRWANAFFSTLLHHIQTSGKGIMAERTAFDNPREAEDNWARSDKIAWLREGGTQKITPKPEAAFPPQVGQMLEFAVSSIRDATGVNVEMLGLADRQQAGVLEAQRTKAGMTILATLFDSLRRYRKEQGRVLLWLIQNFLSDGRLIRIVGEEGAKYVPLVSQPGIATYDVIVDDAPTSPNQKEATWLVLGQLMPTLLSGKIPIPPEAIVEIIKQSPLPDSFAEKLGKIIRSEQEKAAATGPPPDPEMVKAQAKIAADREMQQHQMQSDQAQMAMDAQRQTHEMSLAQAKAQFEAEIRKAELEFEMAMEQQKLGMQLHMESQRAEHERSMGEQRFSAETDLARRKAESDSAIKGSASEAKTQQAAAKGGGGMPSIIIGRDGEAAAVVDGVEKIAATTEALAASTDALQAAIAALAQPKTKHIQARIGDKAVVATVTEG